MTYTDENEQYEPIDDYRLPFESREETWIRETNNDNN